MGENYTLVETHGCIVCARLFDLLVVYDPQERMLDCAVTSPEGQRVRDERKPLVTCGRHTAKQVEAAYARWQMATGKPVHGEEEE